MIRSLSSSSFLSFRSLFSRVVLLLKLQAFVFGVMIEYTICHYAKNQEIVRAEQRRASVLVGTALSLMGAATTSIDDLVSEKTNPKAKRREC